MTGAALERQRAERAAAEERIAKLERCLAQFDDDGPAQFS